jgi:hypothetical protein
MSPEQPDRRVDGQSFGVPSKDPGAPAPPFPGPIGQPVNPVDFFRRAPGGGTVFAHPAPEVS